MSLLTPFFPSDHSWRYQELFWPSQYLKSPAQIYISTWASFFCAFWPTYPPFLRNYFFRAWQNCSRILHSCLSEVVENVTNRFLVPKKKPKSKIFWVIMTISSGFAATFKIFSKKFKGSRKFQNIHTRTGLRRTIMPSNLSLTKFMTWKSAMDEGDCVISFNMGLKRFFTSLMTLILCNLK